jgi:hypothetical protein
MAQVGGVAIGGDFAGGVCVYTPSVLLADGDEGDLLARSEHEERGFCVVDEGDRLARVARDFSAVGDRLSRGEDVDFDLALRDEREPRGLAKCDE